MRNPVKDSALVPDGFPVGVTSDDPRRTAYRRQGKRALDCLLSLILAALFLPILPLVLLAVRIECGGLFFRSPRLGKGGAPFAFYRFRTRRRGPPPPGSGTPPAPGAHAPPVGPVGRFLRRTGIDEVPQLLNVLRGEMSLVGPRPLRPGEAESFDPWERRRLEVTPGMTSLGTVSGRSKLTSDEWMRLDMQYIRNRSLSLDLKILLRTIPTVLSGNGEV